MLFIDRVVRLPRLHPILLEISRTRSTRCEISKFIAAWASEKAPGAAIKMLLEDISEGKGICQVERGSKGTVPTLVIKLVLYLTK